MQHLTLIQQNDIHGQLEPHWEYFWEQGRPVYRMVGGLARAATVIAEARREANGACCVIDGGDAIHGTAPAQWTQGAAIVPVLNQVGIDVMTPGNWEFGFGPDVLRRRAAELTFPLLACNVFDAASGELLFPATQVCSVGGVTIGVIGVATPIVTQTMPQAFGAGLRMTDGIAQVRQAIRRLRRSVQLDLIVVNSHVGLPQDIALARAVDEIDVLLSAHTHDRLTSPVRVGKTLVMQSGCSGSFLGRLDLTLHAGTVVDYRHRLIALEQSITPDPVVQAVADAELAPHRARMAAHVGETAIPLHRMAVLEAPMDTLITAAYQELTGAEVAFSHGWRYGAPIPPGPVTMGDLWQIIPTNPEVFTTTLNGAEIHDLMEDSLESVFAGDPLAQKGGYLIRSAGLSAQVRLNNPHGARVLALEIAGAAWDPERTYTVAAAGQQDVKTSGKEGTGVHAIDALQQYFARHSPVRLDTRPTIVAI